MAKWNDDKTSGAVIGAVVVAALLLIGAQWWPGYQLDRTAAASIETAKKAELVRVLAPVCADRFRKQPDLPVQAAAFKDVDSWQRDSYLVKHKWVIPSGDEDTDEAVAEACADLLEDLVQ